MSRFRSMPQLTEPPDGPDSSAPPSQVRTMGHWRTLDSLIQSSAIELFRSYNVAIAPAGAFIDLNKLDSGAVGGGISFAGAGTSGELVLAVPGGLLVAMGHEEKLRAQDWARELTNQLLGRIKNRLMRYEVRFRTGVPFVLEWHQLRTRLEGNQARIFMFRSLRGDVFVALRGTMVSGDLRFVVAATGPEEGDLLVF